MRSIRVLLAEAIGPAHYIVDRISIFTGAARLHNVFWRVSRPAVGLAVARQHLNEQDAVAYVSFSLGL
jgi:hypothetical protein